MVAMRKREFAGGAVELYRGEALDVLRSFPDESVDAVVTDPPYSSGGAFRSDRTAQTSTKYVQSQTRAERLEFLGDNRDQRSFAYWSTLWLSEALRVTKPGGIVCVFSDWRQLPTTTDAVQAGGWVWRGVVVWDKTEASRPRMGGFRSQTEFVVWGSRGPMVPERNPVALPGVIETRSPRDKLHIAEKPLGLMGVLVQAAPPGGVVLDPFMGSGSTGLAALEEGRCFVGIELGDDIFELSCERFAGAALRPKLTAELAQSTFSL